jgi:hypothetical protein
VSSPYNSENDFIASDFKDIKKFETKLASLKLEEFSDEQVHNIFKEVIEKGNLDHFKLLEKKFKKISVNVSNNNILDKEIKIDDYDKYPLKNHLLDDAVRNCKYELVEYLVKNKKDVTEVSGKKVNQDVSVRNNTHLNGQKFTEEVLDLEWDEIFYNADIQLLESYENTITLQDLNWCIEKFKPDNFIKEVINKIQNNCFVIAEQNKKEEIFQYIKLAIIKNEEKILELIINKINENNKSISAIDNVKLFKKEINEFLYINAKVSIEMCAALNDWKTIINKLPGEDLVLKETEKKPTFVEKLGNHKGKIIAGGLIIAVTAFVGLGVFLLITAFDLKVDSKTFEKTISICKQITKEIASAASGKMQDFKSYAKKSYNKMLGRG